MTGPKLCRPQPESNDERKQSYQDNTDRIEVERNFSLCKRCQGLSLITAKLEARSFLLPLRAALKVAQGIQNSLHSKAPADQAGKAVLRAVAVAIKKRIETLLLPQLPSPADEKREA